RMLDPVARVPFQERAILRFLRRQRRYRRYAARAALAIGALAIITAVLPTSTASAQREWREYPGIERGWSRAAPLPENALRPSELVVGRLMFPHARRGYALGVGSGDWRRGGTAWTVDYPSGDRHFARLLERLSTISVRPVEQ